MLLALREQYISAKVKNIKFKDVDFVKNVAEALKQSKKSYSAN
jgi:hypothetical protein